MLSSNGQDKSDKPDSSKYIERYVADFETTTDPHDCRVWLWACFNIATGEVTTGKNIFTFCQFVSRRDAHVWFHNLSFDGNFILDYIMRNDYAHMVTDGRRLPDRQHFTTVINDMGSFYSIRVRWGNNTVTEFKDSYKKLPMSVKAVSKAFNLEETKGEIDYHAFRPLGYGPTANELEYVTNDVTIVGKALMEQINDGHTNLTAGADAFTEFKRLVGKTEFDRLFPILSPDVDAQIRGSYRGGFTYADPRFARRLLGNGQVFDVNSLYPFIMYTTLLPWGHPTFSDTPFNFPKRDRYPLWIAGMTITATLKPDHIPCIQIKGNPDYKATEYQTDLPEPVGVCVTSVDWELWNEHYDIEILEFHGCYNFNAAHDMFNEYIDKWSEIKANSEGGKRTIAKLMLNVLYGKFGTNPDKTGKVPVWDWDNDTLKMVRGETEITDPIYTAMASFITAYARALTIRAAQKHYDRFAYADTDSLHLVGWEPVDLNVHPTELGAWKHEYHFSNAIFQRAKAYSERVTHPDKRNGKPVKPFFTIHDLFQENIETHIAGAPTQIADQVRFEHYNSEVMFTGKLVPRRAPGGIVLTDIAYTLK